MFDASTSAFNYSQTNSQIGLAVASISKHRQTEEGYSDRHRAKSINYSVIWSFITCYHFSYHWEHHQYPHLPWYKLPLARQKHQS
jgi:fatty acid desaturase